MLSYNYYLKLVYLCTLIAQDFVKTCFKELTLGASYTGTTDVAGKAIQVKEPLMVHNMLGCDGLMAPEALFC